MNTISNTPHKVLWWAIPAILALSLIGLNRTFEIMLHDTYIVMGIYQLGILHSVILGIFGFIYWLFRKIKLVNGLTIFHVIAIIFTITALITRALFSQAYLELEYHSLHILDKSLIWLFVVFIFSQFFLIGNLAFALIRNKRKA